MSAPTTDLASRRVPPLGGLNPALVGIEVRRMLRNRRTVVFALVFPVAMYFIFAGQAYGNDRVGSGNVAAFILVDMALYGAALTAASIGSMVAMERSLGWSRQLRLTPLNPATYILVKALVALLMGGVVIALVNMIAAFQGRAQMPVSVWLSCAAVTLCCTLTFAALGVFVGYVVPGENAMQVLGPGLAALSFLGGVFIPLSQYGDLMRQVAYWTPMYGVSEISRAPLTHELPWYAVLNALGWLAIFVAGAAWRLSRDTARV
ncbi:MAG TPA: ABC transporter permease [Marmoricola sp.]|nr:ABC transporter permease [Marmoricola sp.]